MPVSNNRLVLVVDDDPAICELIADALGDHGLRVRCAHTDREAYETLRATPDLSGLVVDINLGAGHTGFDIARAARRANPGVEVLYVTGQADERSVRTFGVEPSRFLFKPFTVGELREAFGLGRAAPDEAGDGDGCGR